MIDRRAAVGLMLSASLGISGAWAESRSTKPRPLARFPFELLANAIFFRSKVNGKGPYLFSLDTGSSNSVIAAELISELGIASGARFHSMGAGSDMNAAAKIGMLQFELPGGIRRTVTDGAAISMSGLWQLLARRFYGSIGYDVFRPFVLEIDYGSRLITLFDPKTYSSSEQTFSAHMYGQYDPQIDGSIQVSTRPPIPVRLTIDTGAGGTIVSSPLVDRYDLLSATGRITDTQDKGVGGAIPTEVMARLSAINVGSMIVREPLVALSRDKMGSLANEAISVNMGGNILRRFTVVIDYPRKTVALTPNQSFAEPFRSDASGLLLSADSGDFHKFTVNSVVPHSPAADAKLMPGDMILGADGKSADGYALWQFEDVLKASGREVSLSVRRGDTRFERKLKLRSLL